MLISMLIFRPIPTWSMLISVMLIKRKTCKCIFESFPLFEQVKNFPKNQARPLLSIHAQLHAKFQKKTNESILRKMHHGLTNRFIGSFCVINPSNTQNCYKNVFVRFKKNLKRGRETIFHIKAEG